jgi:single-stranded-DNA-specific exonuclease
MSYVALGTVADVAPLAGENRTLVFHGLRSLGQSRNPGHPGADGRGRPAHRGVAVEDIAFRLAPLINAAGRVGHGLDAVQLLCAPGYHEAQQAAKVLERHNEERRRVERQLQDEVLQLAAKETGPTIVLGGDHWHAGVLGIVAARVAETTGKPVLLVAFHGEVGRGSGRCTTGVHLRDALAACGDVLLAHGGHAAAAGLEVRREQFATCSGPLRGSLQPQPGATMPAAVDGTVTFAELDPHTVRRFDLLGPFGSGHPRPRFRTRRCASPATRSSTCAAATCGCASCTRAAMLPARLVRGTQRFEELRSHRGTWTVDHTPRLARTGEDGVVQLDLQDLMREPDASGATPRLA